MFKLIKRLFLLGIMCIIVVAVLTVMSAMSGSKNTSSSVSSAPTPTIQLMTPQEPVVVIPPTPTPAPDLNAQLETARINLAAAQQNVENAKQDALNRLHQTALYQSAASDANSWESIVKQERAGNGATPETSQKWIAAKGVINKMDIDAVATDPSLAAAKLKVVYLTAIVQNLLSTQIAQKKAAEATVAQNAPPHDDLSLFISRFGPPDSEYNSADENPRPLIVTRQLIYKAENVRAVYCADVPIDSPPPYDNWKLIGFQNQTTNAVISPDDMVRVMSHRDRQRTH
jgi:hypothetical protein